MPLSKFTFRQQCCYCNLSAHPCRRHCLAALSTADCPCWEVTETQMGDAWTELSQRLQQPIHRDNPGFSPQARLPAAYGPSRGFMTGRDRQTLQQGGGQAPPGPPVPTDPRQGPRAPPGPAVQSHRAGRAPPQGAIYPGSRRGAFSPLTAAPVPARSSGLGGAARPAAPRGGRGAGKWKGRCAEGWAGGSSLPRRYLSAPRPLRPASRPCGSRRRARRASGRHDGGAGVPRAAPSPGTRGRARNVPPPGPGTAHRHRSATAGARPLAAGLRRAGPCARPRAGWLCWRRPPEQMPPLPVPRTA